MSHCSFCICCSLCPLFPLLAAVAYIDINGTDMTVRVTLMNNGSMTLWSSNQTNYNFSIHRLPTDHTKDPTARCAVFASDTYLVEELGPMEGIVNQPLSALLMCSIVVTDSSSGLIRGCGTIAATIEHGTIIARAVFYRPIGGTLYLLDYGGTCVCVCLHVCACVCVCARVCTYLCIPKLFVC